MLMKSDKIKLLVEENVITRAAIKGNAQGYKLILFKRSSSFEPILYERDSGGVRTFKTLAAACNIGKELGFKKVTVML